MGTSHPDELTALLAHLKREDYCYLTTTGRVSGRPHEIEIWFAVEDRTLYLLSGSDKSDWVKNLRADPAVTVRIGEHSFTGRSRVVSNEDEDTLARKLLAAKYQHWREGRPLSEWARTALPVALDIHQGE